MGLAFPELPKSVCASALLHGSDADFVTNAYLALQRQWPDRGGFEHYMYVLAQPGSRRADVLREIAASDNARRCGVQFIDDLPAEHEFRPEHHDSRRLAEMSLALRLSRTVADVAELRRSLSRLTADDLARAVEAIAQAQQTHHAVLESRISTLDAALAAAKHEAPAGGAPDAAAAADGAPWRHLAAQQMQLQAQLQQTQQAVGALGAELAELKHAFGHLHHYATVDLKRQVADYVNALAAAQRTHATHTPPTRPALRGSGRVPARLNSRATGRANAEHD